MQLKSSDPKSINNPIHILNSNTILYKKEIGISKYFSVGVSLFFSMGSIYTYSAESHNVQRTEKTNLHQPAATLCSNGYIKTE